MTGAQLIDEFLAIGRISASRPRILWFLNLRYEEMLGLESWTFLEGKATVSLTSGGVTGAPSDLGLPRKLYLNNGDGELDFRTLADFQTLTLGDTSPGEPAIFTVYAGTLLVAPTPDVTYPATLLYDRAAIDLADNAVAPITPARTHHGLVAGAQAYALELENDPTGQALEARFQKTIDSMRRRYLTTGRGKTNVFPRDPLGAW